MSGDRPAIRRLSTAAVLGVAAALALWPGLVGLDRDLGLAAALTVFTIGFWALGALPEHLTAVGFFVAAMLLDVAPAGTIFSGFAAQAFWLVFAGLVLALAVTTSGLAQRLATLPLDWVAQSYLRTIGAMVVLGTAVAFLLPSTMGRVVLLVPIVLALADRLGFEAGRPGRTGMALAFVLSTYLLPVAILPANVPNMVLAGAAETIFGLSPRYGPYLLLHFPVLAAAKGVILIWLIHRLFPDTPTPPSEHAGATPLTPEARRLSVILALTLALWATDTVHGIAPAWIGLAAAFACLVPAARLTPADSLAGKLNFGPLLYVAGVLGIAALVSSTRLGEIVSVAMLSVLPVSPGADWANYLSLVGVATVLGGIATMPGIPAVLTPIAADLTAATGWTLDAVIMTQVVGFSTVFLPYQVPPIVVGLALARTRTRDAVRAMLWLAVISLGLLVPINYIWWRALGDLPVLG